MIFTRRDFLRTAAVGAVAWAPRVNGRAATTPDTLREPARELPVRTTADVVVCGAGPAGVAAAMAVGRAGAKTLLLEAHGCLGGIWTAGLLCWILDYSNKRGLMAEIFRQLTAKGGRTLDPRGKPTNAGDVEAMKLVLEEMCAAAGVTFQLHTRVCAAYANASQRLTHVVTESKSGREAVAGQVFVDCTGDGDVGAQAGCGFDLGHPETKRMQPMSLIALVTGVKAAEIEEFYRNSDSKDWAGPKDKLRIEMERGGHSPSYAKPSLFRVRDELFILMANHEYEVNGTDVRDLTAATVRARAELNALIDGLRSVGGPWKNVRLVATAEQIGVREGRRLHGRYVVTADDLRVGREQPDAVCKATFPIDVHATNPKAGKAIEGAGFKAKPYDIPLRALIAKDVDGLLMAGRCISGDFIAHSSYRVTGNAVAMGEAAGAVAALAAKSHRLPHEVEWNAAKAILEQTK